MAITNTFTNGTTADADEVNENFSDLINTSTGHNHDGVNSKFSMSATVWGTDGHATEQTTAGLGSYELQRTFVFTPDTARNRIHRMSVSVDTIMTASNEYVIKVVLTDGDDNEIHEFMAASKTNTAYETTTGTPIEPDTALCFNKSQYKIKFYLKKNTSGDATSKNKTIDVEYVDGYKETLDVTQS